MATTKGAAKKSTKKRWRAPRALVRLITAREHARCIYCRRRGASTLDHVIPRHEKGSNEPNNLVLSCSRCNSLRGACPLKYWVQWCEDLGFGPAHEIALRVATAVATSVDSVKKEKLR